MQRVIRERARSSMPRSKSIAVMVQASAGSIGSKLRGRASSYRTQPRPCFTSALPMTSAYSGARASTVGYGGVTCRLKDMKGLGYIAHLIAHPGHRIHVLDLFAQAGGDGAAIAPIAGLQTENLEVVSDPGGASEVLDSRARAEYRQRLSELHAELEEAERNNDIGCAERTRNELDSLTDGLRSALGLGGRSRRFTAETERARGTVSKSIRVSLERIRRSHQELGAHLSTCLRTGYFCAYLPDPGRQPSWRI